MRDNDYRMLYDEAFDEPRLAAEVKRLEVENLLLQKRIAANNRAHDVALKVLQEKREKLGWTVQQYKDAAR